MGQPIHPSLRDRAPRNLRGVRYEIVAVGNGLQQFHEPARDIASGSISSAPAISPPSASTPSGASVPIIVVSEPSSSSTPATAPTNAVSTSPAVDAANTPVATSPPDPFSVNTATGSLTPGDMNIALAYWWPRSPRQFPRASNSPLNIFSPLSSVSVPVLPWDPNPAAFFSRAEAVANAADVAGQYPWLGSEAPVAPTPVAQAPVAPTPAAQTPVEQTLVVGTPVPATDPVRSFVEYVRRMHTQYPGPVPPAPAPLPNPRVAELASDAAADTAARSQMPLPRTAARDAGLTTRGARVQQRMDAARGDQTDTPAPVPTPRFGGWGFFGGPAREPAHAPEAVPMRRSSASQGAAPPADISAFLDPTWLSVFQEAQAEVEADERAMAADAAAAQSAASSDESDAESDAPGDDAERAAEQLVSARTDIRALFPAPDPVWRPAAADAQPGVVLIESGSEWFVPPAAPAQPAYFPALATTMSAEHAERVRRNVRAAIVAVQAGRARAAAAAPAPEPEPQAEATESDVSDGGSWALHLGSFDHARAPEYAAAAPSSSAVSSAPSSSSGHSAPSSTSAPPTPASASAPSTPSGSSGSSAPRATGHGRHGHHDLDAADLAFGDAVAAAHRAGLSFAEMRAARDAPGGHDTAIFARDLERRTEDRASRLRRAREMAAARERQRERDAASRFPRQ